MLITLLEFWRHPRLRNAYVAMPEFSELYCRKGAVYVALPGLRGHLLDNVLQVARVAALRPRHGAFRRLLQYCEQELRCNVYVENAWNEGFAAALPRLGCVRCDGPDPCFVKLLSAPVKQ